MRYSPVRSEQAWRSTHQEKRKHIWAGAWHNIRYRGFKLYHVLYRRVACRLAVFLCCHAAYIHADGEHSIYGQSAPPVEIPAKDIQKHQKYVHLSVFNAAVLGALFLNTTYHADFFSYMGFGVGIAAGFFIAVFFLHIANERLNSPLIPEAFRGMPIMMVFVGIMSLAFYALTGYNTGAI